MDMGINNRAAMLPLLTISSVIAALDQLESPMERKRKRKGRRGMYPYGRPRKRGGGGDADVIGIRVVDLLDACAGTRTDTRDPILMATVSHGDGIETIAFTLRDTKRLAIQALAVLAHFDVPRATQIVEEHFTDENGIRLNRMMPNPFDESSSDSTPATYLNRRGDITVQY
jgi:hypothetical protein